MSQQHTAPSQPPPAPPPTPTTPTTTTGGQGGQQGQGQQQPHQHHHTQRVCNNCKKAVGGADGAPYYKIGGESYHLGCLICGRCGKQIQQSVAPVVAGSKVYHPDCLICYQCNKPIRGNCKEQGGRVFCSRECGLRAMGMICAGCDLPLDPGTRVINALNKQFHQNCFKCASCQKPFPSMECYPTPENRLQCKECYLKHTTTTATPPPPPVASPTSPMLSAPQPAQAPPPPQSKKSGLLRIAQLLSAGGGGGGEDTTIAEWAEVERKLHETMREQNARVMQATTSLNSNGGIAAFLAQQPPPKFPLSWAHPGILPINTQQSPTQQQQPIIQSPHHHFHHHTRTLSSNSLSSAKDTSAMSEESEESLLDNSNSGVDGTGAGGGGGEEEEPIERTKTLRQLVRKQGVPRQFRGEFWMALTRATERHNSARGLYWKLVNQHQGKTTVDTVQIEKDLTRMNLKKTDAEVMQRLLGTYSWYNNSIGYCQGLHLIIDSILSVPGMEEEQAFWLLSATIENVIPQDYFTESMAGVLVDVMMFNAIARQLFKKLFQRLDDLGVVVGEFVTKWFLSVYLDVMKKEIAEHILDCLYFEGSSVIIRVALGMLKMFEKHLMAAEDTQDMMCRIRDMPDHVTSESALFDAIFALAMPRPEKLVSLRKEFRKQVDEDQLRIRRRRLLTHQQRPSTITTMTAPVTMAAAAAAPMTIKLPSSPPIALPTYEQSTGNPTRAMGGGMTEMASSVPTPTLLRRATTSSPTGFRATSPPIDINNTAAAAAAAGGQQQHTKRPSTPPHLLAAAASEKPMSPKSSTLMMLLGKSMPSSPGGRPMSLSVNSTLQSSSTATAAAATTTERTGMKMSVGHTSNNSGMLELFPDGFDDDFEDSLRPPPTTPTAAGSNPWTTATPQVFKPIEGPTTTPHIIQHHSPIATPPPPASAIIQGDMGMDEITVEIDDSTFQQHQPPMHSPSTTPEPISSGVESSNTSTSSILRPFTAPSTRLNMTTSTQSITIATSPSITFKTSADDSQQQQQQQQLQSYPSSTQL